MKLWLVLLSIMLTATVGEMRYEPFTEKSGSCPPPLPVQICSQSCFTDGHCLGIGKCCPTICGGTVCSKPVTMRAENPREKAGYCPAVPKGRWVCSPTCNIDSDCRGSLKCCRNRCGALTCQKPDLEVLESDELPEDSNIFRNPYENRRSLVDAYPFYDNPL
ncbi:WAP four-disulfide core domain protein 2 [Megalopta genalis]|uniref:WAP four-disulfide core domain protein 2 n=1 Tax=Megalopta genalis TaxID=115081 RepID=UPI001442EA32|nr:WAP four-disulfide core domain protein 2 isoform X1 [Megalopta genalis]XP_033332444.1 WAP four-disulfide core domain protein 2 isoform X1 [Megalopta genalis]XP_033332445.1 WAP four-disulfide core domain protein 2 isoform X1 [Megalopta genalis]XP_033332447.1 WAP four-disulfide core domain protein 2 isoform X1 [Megalopta genalis]XP_033332448.1 WAP four-disulfide core domain protein 2 isoform X2 [Megalopta genalis]